jgi:hypothetical protein
MDLKEIISISGKPGLYKVVARSPKSFIVESIEDKKNRFAVSASQQVSLLDEITIYTGSEENLPLKTVFENIDAQKANIAIPAPQANPVDIRAFFKTIAPGYDEEKVYISDMKKILKWHGLVSMVQHEEPGDAAEAVSSVKKPEPSES